MDFVESMLLLKTHDSHGILRSAACSADSTAIHLSERFAHETKLSPVDPRHLPKETLLTVPQVADYVRKANIKSPCEGEKKQKPECFKAPTPPKGSCHSDEVPFGSFKYMCVCGLAGSMCCGFTHLAIVPLDLIKCRIHVDSIKYPSILGAAKVTVREEGLRTMVKGWAPTAIGYGLQGFGKFGLYEVFKKQYAQWLGPDNAYTYRTWMYLAAASSAEAVGDILLAPFEAAKVRMQTTPGAPSTMRAVLPMIYRKEGLGGLFKGLPPLWMRQIPYTASKFVVFERSIEFLYKNVVPKKREQCTKSEQLVVTFVAGIIAGVVCVVCSHPPDVIVSKLYKDPNATVTSVVRDLGLKGMWKGLGARILMIGSIAAAQLFIVDSVKLAFKLERPPPPEMPESLRKKLATLRQQQ
ncbi:hypothetical protein QR680_004449 [Steinernema hermaphroditum]|uniref:Uncharacterized protein n=1 Tax=Steinernema hermaphroditum TaxID=289476 RepID=A0AA39HPT8_9BILA|nr:hypothetical protein QR680_004449 [Steinernema hermaphroditum]